MIKNKISDLFYNNGCLLEGENKNLYDCKQEDILKYFENMV